jgi:metal-sulfur cluster biosynthetic enzyme
MIDEKQVRQILQTIKHPKLQKSFLDLGLIRDLSIKGDTVSLSLALKSERSPLNKGLQSRSTRPCEPCPAWAMSE